MDLLNLHSVLSEKYISVSWIVTSKCNYKCYHCVDYLNGGKTFPKDYKKMIKFLLQIQNKYPDKIIKLFLIGGEITLWKQFSNFVSNIKEKINIKIVIITNGSAPIKWYKDNIMYYDFILVSYHHQYAIREHFFNLSKLINKKGLILLMMPHNKFDEVLEIGKQIVQECMVYTSPKLLRIDFKEKLYPYTDKQIASTTPLGIKYFPIDLLPLMKGDIIINFKNNLEKLSNPKKVFLSGYHQLIGWDCYGGIEAFSVDQDGEIFVGQCGRGRFGNIYNDDNIILPEQPFICDKLYCNCTADIEASTKTKRRKK